MSIATEDFQERMLALGAQAFAGASPMAQEQGAIKPDEHAAAVGQLMMQGMLGHCEASKLNGSYFVYGVAYAIGSLVAQVPGAALAVSAALSKGYEQGQVDAVNAFSRGGRA